MKRLDLLSSRQLVVGCTLLLTLSHANLALAQEEKPKQVEVRETGSAETAVESGDSGSANAKTGSGASPEVEAAPEAESGASPEVEAAPEAESGASPEVEAAPEAGSGASPEVEAAPEAESVASETGSDEPAEPESDEPSEGVEEIVVVGSRRLVRSRVETLAPVDIISIDDFRKQGATDMNDMLRTMVPAFVVNPQPISDAATLIRPPNLRGLPPDMTLVLVNGKRRHRGAVIAFLGGGVSDGAQAVDLAAIPSIALSRVEVLRDGAAAQYGADAIAGVMNFVLRDEPGLRLETRFGSTYRGDGDTWTVAANLGLPLTDHGFANLSIEYGFSDDTSRSVQRQDAKELRDAGNLAVAKIAQIWGNPRVDDNLKLFGNFGLDINESTKAYLFANYARRSIEGGFYFRNPDSREGVFVRTENDVTYRLVGDLDPYDGVDCPKTLAVGDKPGLEAVLAEKGCFVFNDLFPGGFTPRFGGDITDWSVTGGVKGQFDFGLLWDLSAVVGGSEAAFAIKNTVNASLGPDSPTRFHPGTYRELDKTFGLDLVYPVDVAALAAPLNVAFGLEIRQETFTLLPGDKASRAIGPLFDQGFSIGSNGFPGFSEQQAGFFERSNAAVYVDLETAILDMWAVGLAGRVEHFDTFGTTGTFKASTRVTVLENTSLFDDLSLRATVGTGFRAPSPGQANVTNVTTTFSASGLVNEGTIPPTNPIALAVGARELGPETSLNAGGGIVVRLSNELTLTGDYYFISVKDRISQSAPNQLTPEQAKELEESGIRGATDLSQFTFFTNAFETTTQGVDVVATYTATWKSMGTTSLSFAYNWNRTRVGSYTEGVIDADRISEMEESLPEHRFVLSGSHSLGPLLVLARLNFYGEFKASSPELYTAENKDHIYSSVLLMDLEVAYRFLENFNLIIGVRNLFNTFPDENPDKFLLGAKYPENSPFGMDGGFWYARLQGKF